MAPGSSGFTSDTVLPFRDIPPPKPTTSTSQPATAGVDLAPAGGMDIATIGLVAGVVAAVLVLVVRSRQRK